MKSFFGRNFRTWPADTKKEPSACGRWLVSLSKKYTLMKQKIFPFLSPYDRRSCFYSGTQCGAKNYGAPSKVRAWRGHGEVAFVRGSAQFKPSPAGFFATFLAGTRKVGPRSDRHLRYRRETSRFTQKSWKKGLLYNEKRLRG